MLRPGEQTSNPIAEPPLPRGPYAVAPEVVAADQRRRLLVALPQVVAQKGLEAATVAQIVKLAQVRRNSFYEQFTDKESCFAAAYELAQERLLGVLTFKCYTRAGLAERVEAALTAGLELLASDPATAWMIAIEAPGAGPQLLGRHHEWLERYARMLRLAAAGVPATRSPAHQVELAIVGGILWEVAKRVVSGEAERLRDLAPNLSAFVLSFYRG